MIRLLQRMDDAEPRLPAGGAAVSPQLRRVALLAEADESEAGALEDFARGQEWVRWLLSSIRRRNLPVHAAAQGASDLVSARRLWSDFSKGGLVSVLRPHFLAAWRAVSCGDLQALVEADTAFTAALTECECARSMQAGGLLLQATRHARYQGRLGRYRAACEAGSAPGHFLTVWAGVAGFFQLSLASAAAEYLRLEWEILTWNLPGAPQPTDLPVLAGRMVASLKAELRLLE